ncbi:MAG: metalloregulator ArsR/SmtB family transcription factor [Pseudobdellovibrio sp.]|nr:metalloregulator ArsR/SmtB family transcription factor [Pseudobdellovibrio sp.]
MKKTSAKNLASQCETVASLLKAIAHPQRLKILCCLVENEATVSSLEAYCGASQSSVSQYLAKMKSEGLLATRREGQSIYYKIDSTELLKLMKSMQKIFCEN